MTKENGCNSAERMMEFGLTDKGHANQGILQV